MKEFFDKAVIKKREYDKKKAERKSSEADTVKPVEPSTEMEEKKEGSDVDLGLEISDDDVEKTKTGSETPFTPIDQITGGEGLKRKRGNADGSREAKSEDDTTPSKRLRSETPPPPPPPPPPPENSRPLDQSPDLDEQMVGNPMDAGYAQSEHHIFCAQDLVDDNTPATETLAMELDTAPPPSFQVARPVSDVADTSDSAPSPTLLDPSDMTPIESESERFERAEQSYTGLNLKGVQELEVRDGS